jgi:cell division protein FtsL
MKRVSRNLILCLLAVSMLCGCGQRRRMVMQQASDAKTKMALLEQKVETQQQRIDAMEKEIAELRKK